MGGKESGDARFSVSPSSPRPLLGSPDGAAKTPLIAKQPRRIDSFIRLSWYAVRVLLVSEFVLLSAAANIVYMVFGGSAPKSVDCIGENYNITNVCKERPDDWKTLNCTISTVHEFTSVNVEFGMYCEDTKIVKGTISIQMVGILLGALFWGSFSDTYGRRKALIVSFTGVSILSIATSFTWDLVSFTAARTALAFFNGGLLVVYGVYNMEHIPNKHRFIITCLIAWSPNLILINVLAYFSGDWRTFQNAILVASSPAFLFFALTFESPRWLVQRGRIDEALNVLQKIQEIDGADVGERREMRVMMAHEQVKFESRPQQTIRYNISHLFRGRSIATGTVVFSFGILSTAMISYGLMFNLEALSGSLFLNTIYLGLLRWAFNIFSGVLDFKIPRVGRKAIHAAAHFSVGVCLLIICLFHFLDLATKYPMVIRIATLWAAASCSQVFITKSMSTMEFYPTVIRNTGMSFNATCSRIGTIVGPQIFFIPIAWIPYAILCALSFADLTTFATFIPETKGRPLPENLPEKAKFTPRVA